MMAKAPALSSVSRYDCAWSRRDFEAFEGSRWTSSSCVIELSRALLLASESKSRAATRRYDTGDDGRFWPAGGEPDTIRDGMTVPGGPGKGGAIEAYNQANGVRNTDKPHVCVAVAGDVDATDDDEATADAN